MSNREDGGKAFPMNFGNAIQPQGGMDLRDYFAARAMQAMVAAEFNMNVQAKYWAEESYRVADAMLAERAK